MEDTIDGILIYLRDEDGTGDKIDNEEYSDIWVWGLIIFSRLGQQLRCLWKPKSRNWT